MDYKVVYTIGGSFISGAKTLVETKKQALEHAGYGYGCICIIEEGADGNFSGDPVAVKFEHDVDWMEPER